VNRGDRAQFARAAIPRFRPTRLHPPFGSLRSRGLHVTQSVEADEEQVNT
jgi:hypothetical protein